MKQPGFNTNPHVFFLLESVAHLVTPQLQLLLNLWGGLEDPNASGILIQPPLTEFGLRQVLGFWGVGIRGLEVGSSNRSRWMKQQVFLGTFFFGGGTVATQRFFLIFHAY